MNIERMKKLADHLRSLDSSSQMGFNITEWYKKDALDWQGEECGSVACIAGHAVALFGSIKSDTAASTIREMAQEYLDLTEEQADKLFTTLYQNIRRIVSPEDAANTVKRMIKGEKPWI